MSLCDFENISLLLASKSTSEILDKTTGKSFSVLKFQNYFFKKQGGDFLINQNSVFF